MNPPARSCTTPSRLATCITALTVAVASAAASAEIITYRTTLTVTPGSVQVDGFYDEDGTFFPNVPELAENASASLTPGDRFALTLTVDTSARLSGYDIPPYGRFFNVRNFVLDSTLQPFDTNAGLVSQQFSFGPPLFPNANGGSGGINLSSGYVVYFDRAVFISGLYVSLQLPMNVAGEGLPIGELMDPLDGLTPIVSASLGQYWNWAGGIQFQTSPLVRIIPAPGPAAVFALLGLGSLRRRR